MVIVRKATILDISNLVKINSETLPIVYSEMDYLAIMLTKNNIAMIAEDNGDTVGFIVGRVEDKNRWHIMMLAVSEKYRRRGIATNLINSSIALIRKKVKINKVSLFTKTSNDSGIKFYESYGMHKERIEKDYYGENDDAYFMAKMLQYGQESSE